MMRYGKAAATQMMPAFSRDTDLTGLWTGEYWYGEGAARTPFVAHLIETGGGLSGTTLEPNRFAQAADMELSASLDGARGDLSVRFTKVYDPAPGVTLLPIFYSGTVDAGLTVMEGEWSFNRPKHAQGRFVLVRVSRGAAVAAVETAVSERLRP